MEPYAGGASLALSLLFREQVSEVYLNDLDPAISAFWDSVLSRNREFLQLVSKISVTPREWARQKAVYARGLAAGSFELGFATFFLNRTNHSGILNGGMIGGKRQCGPWRLDARFNRSELRRRIRRVGELRSRIHLSCEDAVEFLRKHRGSSGSLVYLDPPYYQPGRCLYLNHYKPEDHVTLRDCVRRLGSRWVISYDDVSEIRRLYTGVRHRRLRLLHTARSARTGTELVFFSPELRIPAEL
jgi:DNA adenine methylase